MTYQVKKIITASAFALLALGFLSGQAESQSLDQVSPSSTEGPRNEAPIGFRRLFKDMMTVSVPGFYDMVKDGSSMGINVLSGLVRVDRGQEAARSGLSGPRPLSVRVFGIPVYERGQRVRPLDNGGRDEPTEGNPGGLNPSGYEPKVDDDDNVETEVESSKMVKIPRP